MMGGERMGEKKSLHTLAPLFQTEGREKEKKEKETLSEPEKGGKKAQDRSLFSLNFYFISSIFIGIASTKRGKGKERGEKENLNATGEEGEMRVKKDTLITYSLHLSHIHRRRRRSE